MPKPKPPRAVPLPANMKKAPPGAVMFDLWALHTVKGVSPTSGKRYSSLKPRRLRGEPDASGQVTEAWPVAEAAPAAIRRKWGPGRYRVRYLSDTGAELGTLDLQLETPASERAASAALEDGVDQGEAAATPAARLRAVAGNLGGVGTLELLLLMQDNADRAAQRAREEAAAQRAADREYFAAQSGGQTALLTTLMPLIVQARAPVAGGGATSGAELGLLRRELALTVREQMGTLRGEVAQLLAEQGGGGDPDGPETAGEALNLAGVEAVEALGEVAPGLVQEAIGAFRAWMRSKGQPIDPASMAQAIAAIQAAQLAEARANGAAPQEEEEGDDATH